MSRVADALTYARVALTLATYPVALATHEPLFAALILLIVITDVLDGPVARRLGGAGARGANLDSAADFLFYASLPIWTFAFRPAVVLDLLPFIGVFFVGYVVANVASRLRRGVIGFHNRWTRLAGTVGVIVALWIVLWGLDAFLFWIVVSLLTVDLAQRYAAIVRGGAEPAERPAAGAPTATAASEGRKE